MSARVEYDDDGKVYLIVGQTIVHVMENHYVARMVASMILDAADDAEREQRALKRRRGYGPGNPPPEFDPTCEHKVPIGMGCRACIEAG